MAYRQLTKEEITQLKSQNCVAENWDEIRVQEGFMASRIRNTHFEGSIRLGKISGKIEFDDGSSEECGIYYSVIRNCEIAGNVYISEVKYLSSYFIGENVAIENVGSLTTTGETTFGNGIEIEVLNEGGGRELPIFDRMNSQIAYLAVLYRHDREFTSRIIGMIRDYAVSKKSVTGRIGEGSRIFDTQIIRNVTIGAYSKISGACLLEEGTIVSCKEAPVFIGEGVIAKKFIVLSGSRIDSGAIIDKSFVGQGVRMGKQFSAENSVFFANCEAFHGEACSLFAGPYTVTHHKSTLMIASIFSFFNAGSGTNQSNHMYKLGPVHQGIFERGSKTGSLAYMLLPSRVGAFSVVMGKHYSNFDTSDFPFSYISEEKGKSELTPAMNIFTVGTRRDSEKWPDRDRRQDPEKLDLIHFDLFNPYIVGRILNGISILNDLTEKTPKTQDFVNYKGINIHRLLFKTARKYYEMALKVYIGQEIVRRIEGISPDLPVNELRNKLVSSGREGSGKWIEICGLFSPADKIQELMNAVKSVEIKSIGDLYDKLDRIYKSYPQYSWNWCSELIRQQTGIPLSEITTTLLIQIITDWKVNTLKFNNMILKDAEKEFDSASRLGFGIDGDEEIRVRDFEAVRGIYEDNSFVSGLKKESLEIEEKANRLIAILEKIQ